MISEIMFQGLSLQSGPRRLALTQAYQTITLDAGQDASILELVLKALFYPSRLDQRQRESLEHSREVRLAASFEASGKKWRLLRMRQDDSLRLQMFDQGEYKDVAQGLEVERLCTERLHLMPYPYAALLAFWHFEQPIPQDQVAFKVSSLPKKAQDLLEHYKSALAAEALEEKIQILERRVEDSMHLLGESVKLEEKLNKAKERYDELAVTELNEEDLKLLQDRDEQLRQFEVKLLRLQEEERDASHTSLQALPQKPWRDHLFLVGVAISVASVGLSLYDPETLRPVAAANVLGLGLMAWTLLRYFTDMERGSVVLVRLESIKRRISQVREEDLAFRERLNHLLIHAGVSKEDELQERFEKSERLKELIDKMETQNRRYHHNAEHQQARAQLKAHEDTLEALRSEREALGRNMMGSYQLEADLKKMGIDPAEAIEAMNREDKEQDQAKEAPAYERDAFTRLFELAQRANLIEGGELDDQTYRMWSKICGHVLGKRFRDIDLGPEGTLEIPGLTPEQVAMWARTRPGERSLIAAALAMALLVNLPAHHAAMPFVCTSALEQAFPTTHAPKFDEVLRSAAQKAQVILVQKT